MAAELEVNTNPSVSFIRSSAERKVAQYLLSRLEGGWVELDCSAAGLARRLGVSRASLYRALDALAGRGVLRREGRRVQVLQPDALEQN